MNTKLELVRLSNEDVIATSACGVGTLYKKNGSQPYIFAWILDNTTMVNDYPYDATGSLNEYQGYSEQGYYHCDANGNIIEKCTHSQDEDVVLAAHGITVTLED